MPEPGSKNSTPAACLAVMGTGSDVGKSIVATAICRVLVRRGVVTAPYKAQNMSNNSGVTAEGLEMGRAQIVQAEACRTPPEVAMNPVLLKPTSDIGSQVVLLGRVLGNQSAMTYHAQKESLFSKATDALEGLRRRFEAVVIEGAGSCAEVNLMDRDIVNFPMAERAGAPVILVADIHRGGVFAQIVGSLACLPDRYRNRIAGFIVNRFRGDIQLFRDGVDWIEARTGKPVFGVLPWLPDLGIEAEDSVVIENPAAIAVDRVVPPAVAVIRLPHIANFTDFEPLQAVPGLGVHFLEKEQNLTGFDAVILPGSKNTRHDLEWLDVTGWRERIRHFAQQGGHLLGICGGYQMLGRLVVDPQGLEGPPGASPGLSLLPVETVLEAPKTTSRTHFDWSGETGRGYEIHMGRTRRDGGRPLFRLSSRNGIGTQDSDGCRSDDGRVAGTYIHGLFDTPGIVRRWFASIGVGGLTVTETHGPTVRERAYERLADHFESHVDTEAIVKLVRHR